MTDIVERLSVKDEHEPWNQDYMGKIRDTKIDRGCQL